MIVMTWAYFPEKEIVQISQENAAISIVVLVTSVMLLAFVFILKYREPSLLKVSNERGKCLCYRMIHPIPV